MFATTQIVAQSSRSVSRAELHHVLQQAVALRAVTYVRIDRDMPSGKQDARGEIVAASDTHLTLRLDDHFVGELPPDATICIEVSTDTALLVFEAPRENVTVQDRGAGLVDVTTPTCATLVDRRRSPRRRYAETAPVQLRAARSGADHEFGGRLLNLSGDGMACRVTTGDAASLGMGSAVAVGFTAGRSREAFALEGTITNITPAGTDGFVVIGMRFEYETHGSNTRTRLLAVLGDTAAGSSEDPS